MGVQINEFSKKNVLDLKSYPEEHLIGDTIIESTYFDLDSLISGTYFYRVFFLLSYYLV